MAFKWTPDVKELIKTALLIKCGKFCRLISANDMKICNKYFPKKSRLLFKEGSLLSEYKT